MKAPETIAPGDIYWLCREHDLPLSIHNSLVQVHKRAFGHPVLVVDVSKSGHTAQVCTITSLGGYSFDEYHASSNRSVFRQNHIPISPAAPHPDTNLQLHLQSGDGHFDKLSYVKTGFGNVFLLPRQALDCSSAVVDKLTPDSLQKLHREMVSLGCRDRYNKVQDLEPGTPPSSPRSRSSSSERECELRRGTTTPTTPTRTNTSSAGRYQRTHEHGRGRAFEEASWRDPSPTNTSTTATVASTNRTRPRAVACDRLVIPPRSPSKSPPSSPRSPTFTPLSPLCRLRSSSNNSNSGKSESTSTLAPQRAAQQQQQQPALAPSPFRNDPAVPPAAGGPAPAQPAAAPPPPTTTTTTSTPDQRHDLEAAIVTSTNNNASTITTNDLTPLLPTHNTTNRPPPTSRGPSTDPQAQPVAPIATAPAFWAVILVAAVLALALAISVVVAGM